MGFFMPVYFFRLSVNHFRFFEIMVKIWQYPVWVGISILSFALVGCSKPAGTPNNLPPVKVKTTHPIAQSITEWDEFTGRVEAANQVDIRAKVGGYLEKVHFKAGSRISKGDLLFSMDSRPYQAQLNYARAELERVKSKREQAKNDLFRAENLLHVKAISVEEYDARLKDWRDSNAALQSAEANVYGAQLNVDYCQIRSPISGRVTQEPLSAGNFVNGGDSTVLTRIISIDPIYVYTDIDEKTALKYRRQSSRDPNKVVPGQLEIAMEAQLSDESGYPHHGKIDYFAPQENRTTGTVLLRGIFANTDESLIPGFFVRIRIPSEAPHQVLLLPDKSIGIDQTQRFVWVVNQEQLTEQRRITTGRLFGDQRIIHEGLQTGDAVVIEGQQRLRPGIKVNPEPVVLPVTQNN